MPTGTSRPTVPDPVVFRVRVTGTMAGAPPSVAVELPVADASALSLSRTVNVCAAGLPREIPSPFSTTLLGVKATVSEASTRRSSIRARGADLVYTQSPTALVECESALLNEMVVVGNGVKSAPLVAVPPVRVMSAVTVPFNGLGVVTRVTAIDGEALSPA